MKGSKLPKLAALLLVLTLATTCFVSGTFAKYVSEGEGEDAEYFRTCEGAWLCELATGSKRRMGRTTLRLMLMDPPSSLPLQKR